MALTVSQPGLDVFMAKASVDELCKKPVEIKLKTTVKYINVLKQKRPFFVCILSSCLTILCSAAKLRFLNRSELQEKIEPRIDANRHKK